MIYYMLVGATIYMILKNCRTFYVRSKIITAIWYYRIDNLTQYNHYIDYNYMESYNKTLFRLWDWGCKRIVPKEIYNRIKDYIE